MWLPEKRCVASRKQTCGFREKDVWSQGNRRAASRKKMCSFPKNTSLSGNGQITAPILEVYMINRHMNQFLCTFAENHFECMDTVSSKSTMVDSIKRHAVCAHVATPQTHKDADGNIRKSTLVPSCIVKNSLGFPRHTPTVHAWCSPPPKKKSLTIAGQAGPTE